MTELGREALGLSQGCSCLWDWLGRTHFLALSLIVVGRIHFLPPFLTSSSSFNTLPHTPLQRASYNMAAYFLSVRKWRAREGASKRESPNKTGATVFCNVVTQVTTHCFCHILFVRNKSLDPAHIQGQECQEYGIPASYVRSWWPQSVIKTPPALIPTKPLKLNLKL